MKLLISLIIIILLSTSSFSQECETGIVINSDVPGFIVTINDSLEFIDQNKIQLGKGFYNITVKENSSRWNTKSFSDSFQLDSCETKQLNFSFLSGTLIDSDPQDVQVIVGDSLLGYTPLILPYNFDRIVLRKSGYAEKEILIDQRMSKINVSLDFIGEMKKESFFDKSFSKILFGSMIALGATSAYYKIKADHNYDEYLRTGDVKYKDRTSQFDLISGITFGLTQINFGYLIYKIFIDK
ncbi:MAG: hypothetical protein MUO34_09915 [Ignavibacteriaceae bacterium]|nr:hypothetical protein [Ignavibacteriaceae bacterium]